jgi:hypothetical protein
MPVQAKPLLDADCIRKILIDQEVECTMVKNGAAIVPGERADLDPPIVFHVDEVFDVLAQQDVAWDLDISIEEFDALRKKLCDPLPDEMN